MIHTYGRDQQKAEIIRKDLIDFCAEGINFCGGILNLPLQTGAKYVRLSTTLCGLRTGQVMPEVSRFFGIIIRMFVEAGGQHHMPHFHAYYQDDVGIYDIAKIERLAGSLPRRQERLVLTRGERIRKSYCRSGRRCNRAVFSLRLTVKVRCPAYGYEIYRIE